jgi:flavodoxin I
METLVVYDSVYGNTEKIADAIGKTLGTEVVKITDLPEDGIKGINLMVVGSLTRGFRPLLTLSQVFKTMRKKFGYASKPISE